MAERYTDAGVHKMSEETKKNLLKFAGYAGVAVAAIFGLSLIF